MWKNHERLSEFLTEASCQKEIQSIQRYGQQHPVLGRPLRGDATHKIELIYGSRRLFAARHLGIPLHVDLREVTDRQAFVAMDIENRHRQDVSAYERGLSYASWLRQGIFTTQKDLATELGISLSQVSRLAKFAALPSVVVRAFHNPQEIKEDWCINIVENLADEQQKRRMFDVARSIATLPTHLPATSVYERLLYSELSNRRRNRRRNIEVVRDNRGAPLFRIVQQRSTLHVVIPLESISTNVKESLTNAVKGLLVAQKRDVEPAHRHGRKPLLVRSHDKRSGVADAANGAVAMR